MVAYAAVGIPLVHYVPSQDAVATSIPHSPEALRRLVVFDNEDHVGIYLGDGIVLQAPHPGTRSTSCRCTRTPTTSRVAASSGQWTAYERGLRTSRKLE